MQVQTSSTDHPSPGHRIASAVAVYENHTAAEQAIKALQHAGIDMKRLSIVGKDFHSEEHPLGFYTSGERMKYWGGLGAFWGSLWGVLFGSALFVVPVIGPMVVMGPLVGWIAAVLEGAMVGGAVGVLGGALGSIGIPTESIVEYETLVKAGKFVVIANGTEGMIDHARNILGTTQTVGAVGHHFSEAA